MLQLSSQKVFDENVEARFAGGETQTLKLLGCVSVTVASGEEGLNDFQNFEDIIYVSSLRRNPLMRGLPRDWGHCRSCQFGARRSLLLTLPSDFERLVTLAGPKKIGTNQTS